MLSARRVLNPPPPPLAQGYLEGSVMCVLYEERGGVRQLLGLLVLVITGCARGAVSGGCRAPVPGCGREPSVHGALGEARRASAGKTYQRQGTKRTALCVSRITSLKQARV